MKIVEMKTIRHKHIASMIIGCFIQQLKFHRIGYTTLKIVGIDVLVNAAKIHKSSIVFSSIELIACKTITANI